MLKYNLAKVAQTSDEEIKSDESKNISTDQSELCKTFNTSPP